MHRAGNLRHAARLKWAALLLMLAGPAIGCQAPAPPSTSASSSPSSNVTDIRINPRVIRSNVKRFGINLSNQTFYDSAQMLRGLSYRNPGFEGEIWQTILQCKVVKDDACADNDEWSAWPADFVKGAAFEFFYGAAKGQTGVITGNTVAASAAHQGVWISFGHLAVHPKVGDFYILRMKVPGDPTAGWWPETRGGATITPEYKDLSPHTPGKQAIRLNAVEPGQMAKVTSNIDSWAGRSFLQLNGPYTLDFRAKGAGGSNTLVVSITRMTEKRGNVSYFRQTLPLTSAWQDFHYTFNAHEDGTYFGPIALAFEAGGEARGSAVLLDDVALTESARPDNPTAFRNAVVDRLRELQPGVLRYMDNGVNFGSTIDNLLLPVFARERAGFGEGTPRQEDIPIGLHEFLTLCQAVHADPWFTMPAGMKPEEMKNLVEYFAGPASSPYGAKRAKLGRAAPWTQVFSTIHLELGNETWNSGGIGESILDPVAYATRVASIFPVAKAAPFYDKDRFDLIMDGWSSLPWWNENELSIKTGADTIDIAPYTFVHFNDASSPEAIFGPMFAQPEAFDSRPAGIVQQQAQLAAKGGVKLAVYEVNLSTTDGSATQEQVEATVPSLGAGLSVAEHMLLMLRDDGIVNQALFALPEYENGYSDPAKPNAHMIMKLWGSVIDMGGQTNRVRPTFAAEALANSAIGDSMLETIHTGANPTWDQPESANDKIKLAGAHFLQSFAFERGSRHSLVVFNLSRSGSLPVTFSGANPPHGAVEISRLTAKNISDTNEVDQKVATTHATTQAFKPGEPYALPPYSMTVFTWKTQ